jgi:IS30 family transposase
MLLTDIWVVSSERIRRVLIVTLKKVTEEDVIKAVKRLNNRPRKCLGYRTPSEIFWKEARVALAI